MTEMFREPFASLHCARNDLIVADSLSAHNSIAFVSADGFSNRSFLVRPGRRPLLKTETTIKIILLFAQQIHSGEGEKCYLTH